MNIEWDLIHQKLTKLSPIIILTKLGWQLIMPGISLPNTIERRTIALSTLLQLSSTPSINSLILR